MELDTEQESASRTNWCSLPVSCHMPGIRCQHFLLIGIFCFMLSNAISLPSISTHYLFPICDFNLFTSQARCRKIFACGIGIGFWIWICIIRFSLKPRYMYISTSHVFRFFIFIFALDLDSRSKSKYQCTVHCLKL